MTKNNPWDVEMTEVKGEYYLTFEGERLYRCHAVGSGRAQYLYDLVDDMGEWEKDCIQLEKDLDDCQSEVNELKEELMSYKDWLEERP